MSILSLDEAKKIIANSNAGTSRPDDADVQADIDTAESQIAEAVGPLEPTVITSVAYSYGAGGCLLRGPYIGPVTALTVNGDPADAAAIAAVTVDPAGFARGLPRGTCAVTYMAGWAAGTLPADVIKAIREQFRHVWSFRRGNSRTADAERGAGHAMPDRVSELIEPYRWEGTRP